jgi:hypothetical protein
MSHRHLRWTWAGSAAGLFGWLFLALSTFAEEPREPVPSADLIADSVPILQAEREGRIDLDIRGQGDDQVRFQIRNTSGQRLRVVLPPGLVAVAAAGQEPFQSMGLGVPTDRQGSFGQFRADASGFRSMPLDGVGHEEGLVIPADATVDLDVPSVCLNFGLPTPKSRDRFRLVDVDSYTTDPRARKALRSLATLGTSQTVAQAVVWSVFNGLTFPQLLSQNAHKLNYHEVAQAARFIEALDQSTDTELVDPARLTEGRVFVRIQGEGALAEEAKRLNEEIDGCRLLGLPVRALTDGSTPEATAPALHLQIQLTSGGSQPTRGRIVVRVKMINGQWRVLGVVPLKQPAYSGNLDGPFLVDAIDRSVSQAFVSARVAGRNPGSTNLRIENRLPFSVSSVVLQAGEGDQTAPVELRGLGIGPMRSTLAPISASRGAVDRVELNGL